MWARRWASVSTETPSALSAPPASPASHSLTPPQTLRDHHPTHHLCQLRGPGRVPAHAGGRQQQAEPRPGKRVWSHLCWPAAQWGMLELHLHPPGRVEIPVPETCRVG